MSSVTVVLCTAPEGEASGLARDLLAERLVACVNVMGPVTSHYRWEGRVEESREMMLVMKTASELAPRLRERITELHSYSVPEILEFHADSGLPAYLAWVAASCGD